MHVYYEVGTWSSVLIREVSLIQGCPLRGVPLHGVHGHAGKLPLNLMGRPHSNSAL